MNIIPKIFRGNFVVGPNGFCKEISGNWYCLHWFSGVGLVKMTINDGIKRCQMIYRANKRNDR